jgi:hypothetical protein
MRKRAGRKEYKEKDIAEKNILILVEEKKII